MIYTQIGERIEKIRIEHKLSKAQFGKIIGVSGQYIGRIEKNQNNLSLNLVVNICQKMKVSADYILFGITNPLLDSSIFTGLNNLSQEQIQIALEIIKKVAQFVNTENGNEALIQEVVSQLRNNTKDYSCNM